MEILSNIVASQIKIHAKWGGVVPNLAKREHIKNLPKNKAIIFLGIILSLTLLTRLFGLGYPQNEYFEEILIF